VTVIEHAAPRTATTTRLAVVVLNWNAAADTLRCVDALRRELGEHDELIVVDNGSAPDQLEPLAELTGVTLLRNRDNLGFAGGTNVGVRHALAQDAEWVLWWNNDALPRPGAIAKLLATAERDRLAAAQPLLVREHDPSRIDSAGLFGNRSGGAGDWLQGQPVAAAPPTATPILGPCGAAALWRASALRDAGLMHDELFALCEDLDQALRVRQAGGRISLVPGAVATHRRGLSGRSADHALRSRRKLWLQRNAVYLLLRDWPLRHVLLTAPIIAFRAAQALWLSRRARPACLAMWRDALRRRRACRQRMRRLGLDGLLTRRAKGRAEGEA